MGKIDLKPYEYIFLVGLLAYTAGQFLIFVFFNDLDALHAQEPIDFAHWLMLIGVLLLTPQATHFPKFIFNLLGTPLLILGIGLIIGMCVLDFVFWSIKSPELKSEIAAHLIGTPAIWAPFMTLSGKIFNLGLLISSFSYFNTSKVGPLVVLLGTFIVYAGGGWLNVLGYLVLTAGFAYCFYKQNLSQEA
ncbi:MAG: hypothetical protein V2I41_18395 [Pseudomonadales bacterium]|jgi:hypothetical protein|nr:hypothetical protein [Pseudomonadales bacterium]